MAAFALDLGHDRGQSRTAAKITRSAVSLPRSQPRPCRAACPQGMTADHSHWLEIGQLRWTAVRDLMDSTWCSL